MTIVVGYVATREGRAALRRAADECLLRSAPLVVVSSPGERQADEHEGALLAADLERVTGELHGAGLQLRRREAEPGGSPADDLMDAAEAEGGSLIVIGLRRRSSVGKLILGANAQRVLLDAPCPVLSVHSSLE